MPFNSLRPIRERKGMTLAQLAGKSSISTRTLQSYEAGERSIAVDDLRKLSRILLATTAELLQPSEPPPAPPPTPRPPPPAPVEAIPVRPPVAATPITVVHPPTAPPAGWVTPGAVPPRRPFVPRPREAPTSGVDGDVPARPRPVRPVRESRPPRPPGPATAGQIEQLRNIARRMALDDAEIAAQVGTPIDRLDHASARVAITKLLSNLEESGTWQPRVAEGPDHEGDYLARLRDRHAGLEVHLITGERVSGVIEDTTAYLIRLRNPDDGSEISVRKLAIAYYQTRGAGNDPQ